MSSNVKCFKIVNKIICLSNNFIFQPQNIEIDFEIAIYNAGTLIRPNTKFMSFRFHITQSLWRAMQIFSLTDD